VIRILERMHEEAVHARLSDARIAAIVDVINKLKGNGK